MYKNHRFDFSWTRRTSARGGREEPYARFEYDQMATEEKYIYIFAQPTMRDHVAVFAPFFFFWPFSCVDFARLARQPTPITRP